jgi:hypothetical protein
MAEFGAYGFQLGGLPGAERWMQPQAAGSPVLHVTATQMAANRSPSRVDSISADISLLGGGRLLARRSENLIRYALPNIPSDPDLLHPYLAPGAALTWQWEGREALHAGVFATEAGAVLLSGRKEAGKSTTLAWLAETHGVTVIADDLAVIDNGRVLAGPRTIDLRSGPVAGPTERHPRVRDGQRLRMTLPPAPAPQAVIGSVILGWGPQLALTRVPPAERIAMLAAQRYFRLEPDSRALLELAAQPMFTLIRPRAFSAVAEAGSALMRQFA